MERAIVTARVAPLFLHPRDGAELADEALHGMTVNIIGHKNGFVHVRTDYGYEGFTLAEDVLVDDGRAAIRNTEAHTILRAAAVDVLEAPRVQSNRLITLTRGCAVAVRGDDEDGWTRVLLADGREGFIRSVYQGQTLPVFDPADEAGFRRRVTASALSYHGTQYRWGGKTPEGIDCSGLCFMAYWLNGVHICRDARLEPGFPVRAIPRDSMRSGDLLYFPGHIAMLLRGERFIHANIAAGGVSINSLNPQDGDCRRDLADNLLAVGSIFEH